MALRPEDEHPGQILPASADYPGGEARDVTVPGDNTGTPFEARGLNDDYGFDQAILSEANITPSGNPDTALVSQKLDGLKTIMLNNAKDKYFDTLIDAQAAAASLSIGNVLILKERTAGNGGGARWEVVDAISVTENGFDIVSGNATGANTLKVQIALAAMIW